MPSAAPSPAPSASHTPCGGGGSKQWPSSLRRWLPGDKGGKLQFIASGRNAFIYSQVSASGVVSTTTVRRACPHTLHDTPRCLPRCRVVSRRLCVRQATRNGVDLAADGRSASTAKQSMLQRWYKWLGAIAVFLAYRAVKELGGKQKAS